MWTFDEQSSTWFYGTQTNGCGVFYDTGLWWANVCPLGDTIYSHGPYPSKEKAMEDAVKRLTEYQQELV